MTDKFLRIKSILSNNTFARKNLILTFVALIEIIAIVVVSTSAWVETISTVEISGGSGKISAPIFTTAKFDGTSSEPLDLSKYFNASGDVHLASASSTDGNNIYFPKLNTTPIKYRKGTINDVNVNYISFSIIVDATNALGDLKFFFNNDPSISIGGQTITDSSVRLAITKQGSNTKVFSKGESASPAVINEAGDTDATFAEQFDTYVQNPNTEDQAPIFDVEYGKTEEVTFTLWLEDPNMNSDFTGKSVTVNNLSLVTDTKEYTVSFVDRTTAFYNGGTGNGLYWVENNVGDENAQMWVYSAGAGKSIKMSQAADDPTLWSANLQEFLNHADSDLYFLRTSASASAPTSQNDSSVQNSWKTKLSDDTLHGKTFTAYSNVVDTYEKFGTWGEVTEILLDTEHFESLPKPLNGLDHTAADISLKVNNVTYEMNYKKVQSDALWRCYIPTEKLSDAVTFSFKRNNTAYTYSADKRGDSLKYFITSSNTGYWEPPATIKIISGTDTNSQDANTVLGTASASVGDYSGKEIKVTPGTTVTLNSSDSNNYRFMGWFLNSDYTASADGMLTDDGKFTPTESKTYTFYAKFQRQYHVQLTAVTGDSYPDSTGGTVQLNSDGVTVPATSKVDKFLLNNGTENKNVKFTAKISVPEGYKFLGWFDNAKGTGSAFSTDLVYDIGTVDKDYTLYAKFMQIEFAVKAVAKPTDEIGGSKVTFSEPTGESEGTEITVTVLYNNKAKFVAKPDAANGYEFEGWYSDEALTNKIAGAGAEYEMTITKATTLYAKFKLRDVTLTAKAVTGTSESAEGGTVKINGGTATTAGASDSITVKYGTSATLTANAKDGYEFKGWFTSATGGSPVTGIANNGEYTDTNITLSNVKDDSTVYARFATPYSYELRGNLYDDSWNTGKAMTAYTESGKVYTTVSLEANKDYEFKVKITDQNIWYTNPKGTTIDNSCENLDFSHTVDNSDNTKIKVSSSGNYNFIFDTVNKTLTVTKESSTGGDTKTFYFTNSEKWSGTVYCYAWKGSDKNADFPGVAMTYVKNNGYGQNIYKIELDTSKYENVIFSAYDNGAEKGKTRDIPISDFNGNNLCYLDDSNNVQFNDYS